mgnify:CR=1 FL=1
MGWIIMCRCYEDWFNRDYLLEEVKHNHIKDKNGNFIIYHTFITHYELTEEIHSNWEILLISVYFSFTSLSTVGFGDYAPLADHERLIGAAMLLFGVLIFSYIMGKFLEMVDQVVVFNQSLEESEQLTKFFGVLNHFNKN